MKISKSLPKGEEKNDTRHVGLTHAVGEELFCQKSPPLPAQEHPYTGPTACASPTQHHGFIYVHWEHLRALTVD